MSTLDWSTGQKRNAQAESEHVLSLLKRKLANHILSAGVSCGDAEVKIGKASVLDFFRLLKLDSELQFNFLVDITAVDWLDRRPNRFEVVYHLMSLVHGYRLRVKVSVPEDDPQIDSLCSVWTGANFMEREVWDMYGISFAGHPDLRRILMYEEFQGHPLRKDYPLQGKQPRVKLRYPEVHNTARDMQRTELVAINPRSKAGGGR